MVWPEDADPASFIVCGPVGDCHIMRVTRNDVAHVHPRVPMPGFIVCATDTALPSFAVVVDYDAHQFTVRFFRYLEPVCMGVGPYDAFIPKLEARGGRLSSQTTQLTLTDDSTFQMWDGTPIRI